MNNCPSGFKLTQYHSRDLSDPDMAQIEEHLTSCEECRLAIDEMKAEIAPFSNESGAHHDRLLEAYGAEAKSRGLARRRIYAAVGGLAAAAAVTMIIVFNQGNSSPADVGQTDVAVFRSATTVMLEIVAKRAEQRFPVLDGNTLQESDLLRFWVTLEKPGYVSIISVEGSGDIFEFYPPASSSSDPAPMYLGQAGRQRLENSIVLDDAVGPEWLILLYSPKSFDRAEMHEKMRVLLVTRPSSVGVLDDCQYHFIKIVKE